MNNNWIMNATDAMESPNNKRIYDDVDEYNELFGISKYRDNDYIEDKNKIKNNEERGRRIDGGKGFNNTRIKTNDESIERRNDLFMKEEIEKKRIEDEKSRLDELKKYEEEEIKR